MGISPTPAGPTIQRRPQVDLGELMRNLPFTAGLDLSSLTRAATVSPISKEPAWTLAKLNTPD